MQIHITYFYKIIQVLPITTIKSRNSQISLIEVSLSLYIYELENPGCPGLIYYL